LGADLKSGITSQDRDEVGSNPSVSARGLILHDPVTLIDQLIALIRAERKRSGGFDSFVNYASNDALNFGIPLKPAAPGQGAHATDCRWGSSHQFGGRRAVSHRSPDAMEHPRARECSGERQPLGLEQLGWHCLRKPPVSNCVLGCALARVCKQSHVYSYLRATIGSTFVA
jgi:hypothetical protein